MLNMTAFQFVKPGRSVHKRDLEGCLSKGSGFQRYWYSGFSSGWTSLLFS